MLIDSLLFFNEFEMLEFRLRLLWDKVDRFVIVEADRTHSGKKKPLNFLNEKNRFAWAMEKIVYHPVTIDVTGLDLESKPTCYDNTGPQWKIENQQRNAIGEACEIFAADNIVMISDCDEIPSYEIIDVCANHALPFACLHYVLSPNLSRGGRILWKGTVFATVGQLREYSAQTLRDLRSNDLPLTSPTGWHLSYFGGAEQIKKKLDAFAHQELPELPLGHIEKCLQTGDDLFGGEANHPVAREFYPEYFTKHVPESWWL